MKNRFVAFNILIAIVLLLVLVLSLIFTFSYQQPTGLKQQTGIVSKFNQYDENGTIIFLEILKVLTSMCDLKIILTLRQQEYAMTTLIEDYLKSYR